MTASLPQRQRTGLSRSADCSLKSWTLDLSNVQGFGSGQEEAGSKRMFVQTLFIRLVFVYFLQRKGWLSFNNDRVYLSAL